MCLLEKQVRRFVPDIIDVVVTPTIVLVVMAAGLTIGGALMVVFALNRLVLAFGPQEPVAPQPAAQEGDP